jgi:hypothetical protein
MVNPIPARAAGDERGPAFKPFHDALLHEPAALAAIKTETRSRLDGAIRPNKRE